MDEQYYDSLLNIKTTGTSDFGPSSHYFRYEATSYLVLHTLFEYYELDEHDRFVDFGCGKGRTLFYVHHFFDICTVGIEMDDILYRQAMINHETYFQKRKKTYKTIDINHCLAENYKIKPEENIFYFFNPFSVHIFRKVISNILESYKENQRKIHVVLYYPSWEYLHFLKNYSPFKLLAELPVTELYSYNENERIMIYELG